MRTHPSSGREDGLVQCIRAPCGHEVRIQPNQRSRECWLECIDTYSASSWRYLSEVSWPSWTGRVPLSACRCAAGPAPRPRVLFCCNCVVGRESGSTLRTGLHGHSIGSLGVYAGVPDKLFTAAIDRRVGPPPSPTSYPTNRTFFLCPVLPVQRLVHGGEGHVAV